MGEIRRLFAKENGVGVQWFSFNSKGACPPCKGKGEITPDVARLLALLYRLVDQGNTVVAVERRPELIAAADWVIDMGPGGGNRGGEVLFAGTPEALADCERSETGRCLRCRGGKTV